MAPLISVARVTVNMPDEVPEKTSSWIMAAIEGEMESYAGPKAVVSLRETDLGWTVFVSRADTDPPLEAGLLESYIRARITRALTNAGVGVADGLRGRLN